MSIRIKKYIIPLAIGLGLLLSADVETLIQDGGSYNDYPESDVRGIPHGIGTYGYPDPPYADRAKGMLLEGKVRSAIINYGNFSLF